MNQRQIPSLHEVIERIGGIFRDSLIAVRESGGLRRDQYVRYLQMQYHLTKEVQRYFLTAAAHPCMTGKREFREFLFQFALEEEPHFGIAKNDLEAMGESIGQPPLDVLLWHAYFTGVVRDRPYVRLGAASVLETIGTIAGDVIKTLLKEADYLSEVNTRFIVIHMHETLPHGAQFLLELTNSQPSPEECADIVEGAKQGGIIYLRMSQWALGTDRLQELIFNPGPAGGPDLSERRQP